MDPEDPNRPRRRSGWVWAGIATGIVLAGTLVVVLVQNHGHGPSSLPATLDPMTPQIPAVCATPCWEATHPRFVFEVRNPTSDWVDARCSYTAFDARSAVLGHGGLYFQSGMILEPGGQFRADGEGIELAHPGTVAKYEVDCLGTPTHQRLNAP